MAVLSGSVLAYYAPTARSSDEWQFVAVMAAFFVAMLAVAIARLLTYSTIRIAGQWVVRRRRIAGIPLGRVESHASDVSIDVGPLEITCTLLNFKPDPPFRKACVLRGLGDPIVLAMSTDQAAVDRYADGLPPPLAGRVRQAGDLGLLGPTAVII